MKRLFGLDLIRTIAVILVISVHFFVNNGFYETKVAGVEMFISIFIRWIVYNGVPLFLLLTGYLKNDDNLNKKYYKKLRVILMSYVFISIITVLVSRFYLDSHTRVLNNIVNIFNFTAIKHAWYVEMYIGLFLLIPFLNILYKALKTKENKKKLITTLFIMISVGPIINFVHIDGVRMELIPDWWENLYPIAYFMIGSYIGEYKPKINKKKYTIILTGLIILESVLAFIYNYNQLYSWNFLGGYASIQTIIISSIIFLLLYDINCNNKIIVNSCKNISILSFDIYLYSFIVESIIYKILLENIKNLHLGWMIICVLMIFIISLILSYFTHLLIHFIDNKIVLKKNNQ